MAKKRKSIFETATSNEEIKNAALNVQKETLPSKESREEETPKPRKAKKEKLMHLYVSSRHHRQAKLKAITRGMKLGEYIEWLIVNDKTEL